MVYFQQYVLLAVFICFVDQIEKGNYFRLNQFCFYVG